MLAPICKHRVVCVCVCVCVLCVCVCVCVCVFVCVNDESESVGGKERGKEGGGTEGGQDSMCAGTNGRAAGTKTSTTV